MDDDFLNFAKGALFGANDYPLGDDADGDDDLGIPKPMLDAIHQAVSASMKGGKGGSVGARPGPLTPSPTAVQLRKNKSAAAPSDPDSSANIDPAKAKKPRRRKTPFDQWI